MDAQLICFMSLCLLFALRLWGARKGTTRRLRYLVATALAGAAAISVKWTALATPALVALVSLFGSPFPREGRLRWTEMLVAGGIASVFYVSLFYVHFLLLPESGQGDGFMPHKFQQTLRGGKFYDPDASGPGFVRNFLYLNREMYSANARIKTRHHWESKWYQWIINQRGLLYFHEFVQNDDDSVDDSLTRKIYLIVNPAVSVVTLLALVAFLVIAFGVYLPRKSTGRLQRGSKLPAFVTRGTFFFVAYTVNILPYLGTIRSLCLSPFVLILPLLVPLTQIAFVCFFIVFSCVFMSVIMNVNDLTNFDHGEHGRGFALHLLVPLFTSPFLRTFEHRQRYRLDTNRANTKDHLSPNLDHRFYFVLDMETMDICSTFESSCRYMAPAV